MKKTKAYTILELIIVMAVIAIILSLGFLGLITLRATIQLQSGYSDFISNLKVLQNKAINSSSNTVTPWTLPNLPSVYAIKIDPLSYQFYYCTGTTTLTCVADNNSIVALGAKGISFTGIGCNFVGFSRLSGDIVKIDSTNGTYTTGSSGMICALTLSPNNNQASKTINIDIFNNKIEIPNN